MIILYDIDIPTQIAVWRVKWRVKYNIVLLQTRRDTLYTYYTCITRTHIHANTHYIH